MGNLSKHFGDADYACSCCGLVRIAPEILVLSELIRHFEGDFPLVPSSACRCLKNNERIQKEVNPNYKAFSSRSKHLPTTKEGTVDEKLGICKAIDIKTKNPGRLYNFLARLFPSTYGIGVYSWGVHIDVRPEKARWDRT